MEIFERLAKQVERTYIRIWQPLLFIVKRKRRYQEFVVDQSDGPLHMAVDLLSGPDHQSEACSKTRGYTQGYLTWHMSQHYRRERLLKPWLGTAAVIDLRALTSFEQFKATIPRKRRSAVIKKWRKAANKGYLFAPFLQTDFKGQLQQVVGSKVFRSGGFVPQSVISNSAAKRVDAVAMPLESPRVHCNKHWTLLYGVFIPAQNHAGMTLCAYAKIRRSGNLLHTTNFIGHGDHLAEGVMDFLFVELMQWILDDPDDLTDGVDYFSYGLIEQGGAGLSGWKRQRGFKAGVIHAGGSKEASHTH